MILPNFLIIGAQKSGTTWLNWKLRQHPDVFMPEQEVHFFDREENYAQGLAWYARHFVDVANQKAIGEKTPDYLTVRFEKTNGLQVDIHKRIHQTLPDVKLIVALRNPVDRAVSATYHMIRTGVISPLHKIDDLLVGDKRLLTETFGVFEYGNYHEQLKPYCDLFGTNKILILIYEEDIKGDPDSGINKVCNFLGIDLGYRFQNLHRPANSYRHSLVHLLVSYYLPSCALISRRVNRWLPIYKPEPSKETLSYLYQYYRESNEILFGFLGREIESWRNIL